MENSTPNTNNYVQERFKNIWGLNPQNIYWEHSASAQNLDVLIKLSVIHERTE